MSLISRDIRVIIQTFRIRITIPHVNMTVIIHSKHHFEEKFAFEICPLTQKGDTQQTSLT